MSLFSFVMKRAVLVGLCFLLGIVTTDALPTARNMAVMHNVGKTPPDTSDRCPDLSLSLPGSPYTVDLLATSNRIKVGTVDISLVGKDFVIDVSVLDSCVLVDSVHVDIRSTFDPYDRIIPGQFPCKEVPDSEYSSSLTCPLALFVDDCCDTSLTAIIHAVVDCTGISNVDGSETAFAGTGPEENTCAGPRWCNVVPLTLDDGCVPSCDGITRFDTECKMNKCERVNVTDCVNLCTAQGSISVQGCSKGTCVETGVTPCTNTCNGVLLSIQGCENGVCEEKNTTECGVICDGEALAFQACDGGVCTVVETKTCTNKCSGALISVRGCSEGECKEKETSACPNDCNGDLISVQGCSEGECKEKETSACPNDCNGDLISVQGCSEGECKEKETSECPNDCNGDLISVQGCDGGECREKNTTVCNPTCGVQPGIVNINKCDTGVCKIFGTDNCSNECSSEKILMAKECSGGICDTVENRTCADFCLDSSTVSKQICDGNDCSEETRVSCENECRLSGGVNIAINRNCVNAVCEETVTTCAPCESCSVNGTAECVPRQSCPSGQNFDEETCTCKCANTCSGPKVLDPSDCQCKCPSSIICPDATSQDDNCNCVCNDACGPGEFLNSKCRCVSKPCDACPEGSTCLIIVDGEEERTICRDCSCGYCDPVSKSCCRSNASGVNCVPNQEEIIPNQEEIIPNQEEIKDSCKAEDFSPFPEGDNNNVCAGEEKVDSALGEEFLRKCGCTPGQFAACVIDTSSLSATEKCFVPRRQI